MPLMTPCLSHTTLPRPAKFIKISASESHLSDQARPFPKIQDSRSDPRLPLKPSEAIKTKRSAIASRLTLPCHYPIHHSPFTKTQDSRSDPCILCLRRCLSRCFCRCLYRCLCRCLCRCLSPPLPLTSTTVSHKEYRHCRRPWLCRGNCRGRIAPLRMRSSVSSGFCRRIGIAARQRGRRLTLRRMALARHHGL